MGALGGVSCQGALCIAVPLAARSAQGSAHTPPSHKRYHRCQVCVCVVWVPLYLWMWGRASLSNYRCAWEPTTHFSPPHPPLHPTSSHLWAVWGKLPKPSWDPLLPVARVLRALHVTGMKESLLHSFESTTTPLGALPPAPAHTRARRVEGQPTWEMACIPKRGWLAGLQQLLHWLYFG